MRTGVLAVIALVILIAAALGSYYAVEHRGGGAPATASTSTTAGAGREVVLPLHPGDLFVFNTSWSVKTSINGTINTTGTSFIEEIVVVNVSSTYLISANLTRGNRTASGSLPYALLALPQGDLGSSSIVEPVITPLGGVCMRLRLAGEYSWAPRGWRALLYKGSLLGPGYKLSFEALYNASNGVVLEVNSTAWLISSPTESSKVTLRLVLKDYKPSAGEVLKARLGPNSFCAPAASSDLRLCADGFYIIGRSGVPTPVNGSTIEGALKGPSVIVILNKYCPHCQRFWPNLLNASSQVKAPIYAIIFSGNTGLSNPALSAVLRDVLEEAGLGGQGLATPSILVFPGPGKTPAYRAGEMGSEAFASWVNTVLKASS